MAVYDDYRIYINSLAVVGILFVIYILIYIGWYVLKIIYQFFILYVLPSQSLSKKFGTWAVVTGCTDGIGKAYAKELASRGINIILISRTKEKLELIAKEIALKYAVQTKIIHADFATGYNAIETIKEELEDAPPIGILVNNVGTAYTCPLIVGEVPKHELWDIIATNVGATTMVTRLIIQGMKERGKGAIVNISFGAAYQPSPLFNVYAATKVYVKHFTEALRKEYSKDGITVQLLSPFFVNTKMIQFSPRLQKNTFFVPDSVSYAESAVNTLGKLNHTTGYWTHGIQYFFTTIPPKWIRMKIGEALNRRFQKDYIQHKIEILAVRQL